MKKSVLVTGGTAKDAPAMAALLLNLKATNEGLTDDIVIFHDGITSKDQKIMNKILPVEFCQYHYPGNTQNFGDTIIKYFSTMIFCKYECFKLLNKYHTVIWTDYDVIIQDTLKELLIPLTSGFRMMPDIRNNVGSMFHKNIEEKNEIKNYNMDIAGICMPLFVFYDNMKKNNEYYEYCLTKTQEYASYLYLPEQCVVNMLLQDYNIKVTPIDFSIYAVHPKHDNISMKTKIIHAYGQPKFWNGLINEAWEKNYKTWIKMGGSKYEHRKLSYKTKKIFLKYCDRCKKIIKRGLKRVLPNSTIKRLRRLYNGIK
jgi:lipopolysaccharide biosynthesis glycosyltransferase